MRCFFADVMSANATSAATTATPLGNSCCPFCGRKWLFGLFFIKLFLRSLNSSCTSPACWIVSSLLKGFLLPVYVIFCTICG